MPVQITMFDPSPPAADRYEPYSHNLPPKAPGDEQERTIAARKAARQFIANAGGVV